MKIKSIDISGIGGIKNLKIDFDERMNFICGPNGIGKTTILECVAHSFSYYHTNILKRNSQTESGTSRAIITVGENEIESNIQIKNFSPEESSSVEGALEHSQKLLSLKIARTFQYQPLHSVSKDIEKNNNSFFEEAKHGINIHDVKNWFVNRYLYSAHDDALEKEQLYNFELAKKSFSLLNENFRFKKVIASSNEIMISSPSGDIFYEYLSSGFKSCLSLIFGIIKEIEFRFKKPCIKADEFDGIILIDELELHLHPAWQAKIANILIKVFPKVQFITSTHSPHILQNAKPNEIIALSANQNGVYRRDLDSGSYGFQGWTVEEILIDVMGMEDTRTNIYNEKLCSFEKAILADDYQEAEAILQELEKLLHPENYLRKLLRLDLASIKEAAL